MQRIKKAGRGILLGGIVFLFFILAFENWLHVPAWLKIAGRMHPMFLHFPIVLLLLSFISFWIPFHEESVWKWFDGVRLIAALSAVFTAIMGLLLSLEEERTGSVLQWHKWSGVLVAVSGALFYAFDAYFVQRRNVGKIFTVAAAFIILITGHWGAGLTHGNNYLLAPLASDKKIPVEQALVFRDVIKPIFEEKCVSCHGDGNVKGGLVLDNITELLKGGKTGPLFVAGEPDNSLLIKRLHLPKGDKKHMPPASKPQLADDEIALLNAWIRSGALLDKKLTTLPPQDSFRMIASRFLAPANDAQNQTIYNFPHADNKKIATLNNNYRVIEPHAVRSPALTVLFYGKNMYSSKALEEILDLKQQIVDLNLSRMPVKDDDLKIVGEMSNLTKLNLNYTDITDKGLEHILSLKNLQAISLTGTAVSSKSIERLATMPQLEQVFLWDTPIDSLQITTMRNRFKKLRFETGFVQDDTSMIALSPPLIKTPSGIVEQPTQIEIRHPFKDVDIRYTLDGSNPDSITSRQYKHPIEINDNLVLSVRAFKNGWYASKPVQATFIKKGAEPDSVYLLTPPDPKYKDLPVNLLIDGDVGELNIRNGQWLGYQQNEAECLLYFKTTVTAKAVLLNMLLNTRAQIFPPVSLEVWGGMDATQLKSLGKISPPMPQKDTSAMFMRNEIAFPSTPLQYLKIVARPVKKLPDWHKEKGKQGWVYISEIVVN